MIPNDVKKCQHLHVTSAAQKLAGIQGTVHRNEIPQGLVGTQSPKMYTQVRPAHPGPVGTIVTIVTTVVCKVFPQGPC